MQLDAFSKTVYESDDVVVVITNSDNVVTYVSCAVESILGYTSASVVGSRSYDLPMSPVCTRFHADGSPVGMEVVIHRPLADGGVLRIEKPIEKFGNMGYDTAHLRVVNSGPLGIHVINARGDIEWATDADISICGYDRNEYLGMSICTLHAIKETAHGLLARLRAKEILSCHPVLLRHRDGSVIRVELDCKEPGRASPSSPRNHRSGTVDDEDDCDLDMSSRETQFLAQMSHDIRTPINGVIGMASLLQTTQLTSEQKEFVDTIESSSSLLLALLNDILDITKIESGKINLESIPIDIEQIVSNAVRTLSFEAAKKEVPIRVNSSTSFGKSFPQYIGDPNRIKQVVMNYLSNAVKFTHKGSIEIHLEAVPVEGESNQDMVRIEVKDTGIGIEDTSKLFSPFVQASNSTSREYGGTGLGLSICRQLTERMGGEVGVSSVVGEGTCIWSTIPLPRYTAPGPAEHSNSHESSHASEPSKQQKSKSFPAEWRDKCSILLAEDNKVNQKVMLHMLKRLGFSAVTVVENGRRAVDEFAMSLIADGTRRPYSIILMDCQMPELDGYDATRMIREMEKDWSTGLKGSNGKSDEYRQVPIIALTANASESDRQSCLGCGMSDFCTKPLTLEKLDDVIYAWISRHIANNSH